MTSGGLSDTSPPICVCTLPVTTASGNREVSSGQAYSPHAAAYGSARLPSRYRTLLPPAALAAQTTSLYVVRTVLPDAEPNQARFVGPQRPGL